MPSKKSLVKPKRKPAKKQDPKQSFLANLSKLPSKPKFDTHFWVDFYEIKCLVNIDKCFSIEDFIKVYKSRKELDLISSNEENEEDSSIPNADKDNIFAEGLFNHIESRENIFGVFYPFNVDSKRKLITLKNRQTTNHKLYIFLLLASALNYTIDYKTQLTSAFEILSLDVMKSMLPFSAEVHLFGSGNSFEKNRRYSSHIYERIKLLSTDLNEGEPKVKKTDFPPTATGDSGLDIIGWLSNGDNQPHLLTFMGQSGCTDEWNVKQFSSSYDAWKNKISFSVAPLNFIFAPFSLRKIDGSWHRRGEIGNNILIDRQRLLFHFKMTTSFKKFGFNVVDEILTIKESSYS